LIDLAYLNINESLTIIFDFNEMIILTPT